MIRPILSLATAALLLAACSTDGGGSLEGAAVPALLEAEGTRTAMGTFSGASGHVTTGEVIVVRSADGYVVSLGSDFSLDGAPDPHVSLGDAETAQVTLAPLERTVGAQAYTIPAEVDVGDYDHVYIWCEEFSVPLGVAELELL